MTAEQLYDSLQLASGHAPSGKSTPRDRGLKRRFLDLFATPEASGEPVTSMPQALYLMNGDSIHRAVQTRARKSEGRSNEDLVREAYLAVLGRLPTEGEQHLAETHLAAEDIARPDRPADLWWALLNLPEFRWNH
jgi:hypothetical protein